MAVETVWLHATVAVCPMRMRGTPYSDAPLTFDPEQPRAIAAAIEKLLADPAERDRLSRAGRANAARFSWADTARRTLRVYEREGLIEPDRSARGTRLYSGSDVARLREIAALTGAGINIAGIKRVLELQQEVHRLQTLVDRLDARLNHRRA